MASNYRVPAVATPVARHARMPSSCSGVGGALVDDPVTEERVLGACARHLMVKPSQPTINPLQQRSIHSASAPSRVASHGTYRLVARGGFGCERRYPLDREFGA